ncbi:MAG: pilus assembly protein PilM [Candidatus Zixiibacteriota bacterium]
MNSVQTDTPEAKIVEKTDKLDSSIKRHRLGKKANWGRTISIRFDHSSLQLVAVKKSFKSTKLLNVTKIYIPKTCTTEEKCNEFITVEINRYIKQYRTKNTRYVLGISGQETAQRNITFPSLPKKELDNAVYWEGNKRIPFGLNNSYFGYHLVETSQAGKECTANISLMAVAKEIVDKKLELLQPLNITISSVYHELEALGYLIPFIEGYDPEKSYALINIKERSSEISFYKGDCLKFMNISSVGTNTLSDTPDNDTKFEFFTESLVNEIANTLDYYVGQFANTSADRVFVYGDLSYSEELINNLTDRFGMEFKKFPIDRLEEEQKVGERFNTDLSVSLSGVALAYNNYALINFLPPYKIEQQKTHQIKRFSVAGMALLIFILIGIWSLMEKSNQAVAENIKDAKIQIENIHNSPTFVLYNQIKNRMAAERAFVDGLHHEPTYLNLNLKELSIITPKEILLTGFNLQKIEGENRLYLSGKVASSDPPPEVILAEFIARLENSTFYNDISLKKHIKQIDHDKFIIDFVISARALI